MLGRLDYKDNKDWGLFVATIKDVARLAGVGLGTASRVVRGKGSVSPAKLERVRKAIDALGYRPSHAARSLLYGSSRMVGIYIPLLSGTFYAAILQIIDAELRQTVFQETRKDGYVGRALLHAEFSAQERTIWQHLESYRCAAALPAEVTTLRVFDVLAWMEAKAY